MDVWVAVAEGFDELLDGHIIGIYISKKGAKKAARQFLKTHIEFEEFNFFSTEEAEYISYIGSRRDCVRIEKFDVEMK